MIVTPAQLKAIVNATVNTDEVELQERAEGRIAVALRSGSPLDMIILLRPDGTTERYARI